MAASCITDKNSRFLFCLTGAVARAVVALADAATTEAAGGCSGIVGVVRTTTGVERVAAPMADRRR
jgi:hypothetical protein